MADVSQDVQNRLDRMERTLKTSAEKWDGVSKSVGVFGQTLNGITKAFDNFTSKVNTSHGYLGSFYESSMKASRGLGALGTSVASYERELDKLDKTTLLSRKDAQQLFSTLEEGMKGMRNVSEISRTIKMISDIGITASETARQINSLNSVQNQYVDIARRIQSGGRLSFAEKLNLDPQQIKDMDNMAMSMMKVRDAAGNMVSVYDNKHQREYMQNVQRMNKELDNFKLQIQEALMPVMIKLAQGVTYVTKALRPLVDTFRDVMRGPMGQTAAIFLATNLALKFLFPSFITLAKHIGGAAIASDKQLQASNNLTNGLRNLEQQYNRTSAAAGNLTQAQERGSLLLNGGGGGTGSGKAGIGARTAGMLGSVGLLAGTVAMAGGVYLEAQGRKEHNQSKITTGGVLSGAGGGLSMGMMVGSLLAPITGGISIPICAAIGGLGGAILGFLRTKDAEKKERERREKEESEAERKESQVALMEKLTKQSEGIEDRYSNAFENMRYRGTLNVDSATQVQYQKVQEQLANATQRRDLMIEMGDTKGEAFAKAQDEVDNLSKQLESGTAIRMQAENAVIMQLKEAQQHFQNLSSAIKEVTSNFSEMGQTTEEWGLNAKAASMNYAQASEAAGKTRGLIAEQRRMYSGQLQVSQQGMNTAARAFREAKTPQEQNEAMREYNAKLRDTYDLQGKISALDKERLNTIKQETELLHKQFMAGVNVQRQYLDVQLNQAKATQDLTNAMRLGMGPSYESMIATLQASKAMIGNTQAAIDQGQAEIAVLKQKQAMTSDINEKQEYGMAINRRQLDLQGKQVEKTQQMTQYLEQFNKMREGYIEAMTETSLGGLDVTYNPTKASGLVHFMKGGGHSLVGMTEGGGATEASMMGRFGMMQMGNNAGGMRISSQERAMLRKAGYGNPEKELAQNARGYGDINKFMNLGGARGQELAMYNGGIASQEAGGKMGRAGMYGGVSVAGVNINTQGVVGGRPTPGVETGGGNALGAAGIKQGYRPSPSGGALIGAEKADVGGDFTVQGNLIIKGNATGGGGGTSLSSATQYGLSSTVNALEEKSIEVQKQVASYWAQLSQSTAKSNNQMIQESTTGSQHVGFEKGLEFIRWKKREISNGLMNFEASDEESAEMKIWKKILKEEVNKARNEDKEVYSIDNYDYVKSAYKGNVLGRPYNDYQELAIAPGSMNQSNMALNNFFMWSARKNRVDELTKKGILDFDKKSGFYSLNENGFQDQIVQKNPNVDTSILRKSMYDAMTDELMWRFASKEYQAPNPQPKPSQPSQPTNKPKPEKDNPGWLKGTLQEIDPLAAGAGIGLGAAALAPKAAIATLSAAGSALLVGATAITGAAVGFTAGYAMMGEENRKLASSTNFKAAAGGDRSYMESWINKFRAAWNADYEEQNLREKDNAKIAKDEADYNAGIAAWRKQSDTYNKEKLFRNEYGQTLASWTAQGYSANSFVPASKDEQWKWRQAQDYMANKNYAAPSPSPAPAPANAAVQAAALVTEMRNRVERENERQMRIAENTLQFGLSPEAQELLVLKRSAPGLTSPSPL